MSDYTIKLSDDMVDNIVVDSLRNTLYTLRQDLGAFNNVFAWDDPEQDDKEIQRHIDAYETVLKWVATSSQLIDMGLKDD